MANRSTRPTTDHPVVELVTREEARRLCGEESGCPECGGAGGRRIGNAWHPCARCNRDRRRLASTVLALLYVVDMLPKCACRRLATLYTDEPRRHRCDLHQEGGEREHRHADVVRALGADFGLDPAKLAAAEAPPCPR